MGVFRCIKSAVPFNVFASLRGTEASSREKLKRRTVYRDQDWRLNINLLTGLSDDCPDMTFRLWFYLCFVLFLGTEHETALNPHIVINWHWFIRFQEAPCSGTWTRGRKTHLARTTFPVTTQERFWAAWRPKLSSCVPYYIYIIYIPYYCFTVIIWFV
jgi:hypothetical protein